MDWSLSKTLYGVSTYIDLVMIISVVSQMKKQTKGLLW